MNSSTPSTGNHLHPRFGILSWVTISLSPVVEQQGHWLEDTVCLELMRHKGVSIVSISKIIEVIVSNCSSLMLWNLQYIQQQFWMKECDILKGDQNILWPLLHIFRGSGPPNPQNLRSRSGVLFWATIILSPVEQQRHWLEDTVCLELISRHNDGSIVSISKISEVIVSNCSSLMLWNLQLYNNSFEQKNVTFLGGQNILWLLLHIFRRVRTPTARIQAPVLYTNSAQRRTVAAAATNRPSVSRLRAVESLGSAPCGRCRDCVVIQRSWTLDLFAGLKDPVHTNSPLLLSSPWETRAGCQNSLMIRL